MRVLVLNAGSSSLKLRLVGVDNRLLWEKEVAAPSNFSDEHLRKLLTEVPQAEAVGHRIVHGGSQFRTPALITPEVLAQVEQTTTLAPLHNPPALRVAKLFADAHPGLPAVACFDTTFHRTLPPAAATYPVPAKWRERYQLQRYGFHGLSHAWATRKVSELMGSLPSRLISCHLGAGASLAAIFHGRSVDTTMGFTPLEGIMMAIRSGSVDPGMVLWLIRQAGLDPVEVEHGLTYESGLLGLSGHADLREVLTRADNDDESARLAIAVYLHRLRAGIGSMAAALGGVDALVFTGGVGENASVIRAETLIQLGFLGMGIDPGRNSSAIADTEITAVDSRVRVFVIRAREDLEIAYAVRKVIRSQG